MKGLQMKIIITLGIEVPNKKIKNWDDVVEWAKYTLGYSNKMTITNPLLDQKLNIQNIDIKLNK